MSTTILSVMLLIYSQIIYMIFYFHYFGYVGGGGYKVYHINLFHCHCHIMCNFIANSQKRDIR